MLKRVSRRVRHKFDRYLKRLSKVSLTDHVPMHLVIPVYLMMSILFVCIVIGGTY